MKRATKLAMTVTIGLGIALSTGAAGAKKRPQSPAPTATVVGERGEKGERGDTGERGERGEKGEKGEPASKATWEKVQVVNPFIFFATLLVSGLSAYFSLKASRAAQKTSAESLQTSAKLLEVSEASLDRARLAAATDTFLKLRAKFAEVRRVLSDVMFGKEVPKDAPTQQAMLDYWYCAFDEWFVTTQLFTCDLNNLWNHYYKDAIRGVCDSDAMICALEAARAVSKVGIDHKFYNEVMTSANRPMDQEAVKKRLEKWAEAVQGAKPKKPPLGDHLKSATTDHLEAGHPV